MGVSKTDRKQRLIEESNARGRPSDYNPELTDKICSLLAEGISLRTICSAPDMPSKTSVFRWMRTNEDFRVQYEKAKEESADALVEEMLDIADENPVIIENDENGGVKTTKLDSAGIARNRLRVDTRKWVASKLKPKRFGDKTAVEHSGVVEIDHFNDALTNFMAIAEKKLA